jgi:hypothetical protein
MRRARPTRVLVSSSPRSGRDAKLRTAWRHPPSRRQAAPRLHSWRSRPDTPRSGDVSATDDRVRTCRTMTEDARGVSRTEVGSHPFTVHQTPTNAGASRGFASKHRTAFARPRASALRPDLRDPLRIVEHRSRPWPWGFWNPVRDRNQSLGTFAFMAIGVWCCAGSSRRRSIVGIATTLGAERT